MAILKNYSVSLLAGRDPIVTVSVDATSKAEADTLAEKIFEHAGPLIHEHYETILPRGRKAKFHRLTIENKK